MASLTELLKDPFVIGGGLGLIGNIGGSLISGSGGGASFTSSDRASIRRPTDNNALGMLLSAEQLLRLGASPDVIGEELLLQQVETGGLPATRRLTQSKIGEVRNALLRGDEAAAGRALNLLNIFIKQASKNTTGIGAVASIDNGELTFQFNDPTIDSVLQTARTFGNQIALNRAEIIKNITASAAEGTGVLRGEALALSDQRFDELRDQIRQEANVFGTNPAKRLADLDVRQVTAGTLDAVSLANQLLLGNIQVGNAALDPTGALSLLGLQNQSAANSAQIGNAQGTAFQQINAGQGNALGQGVAGGLGSLASAFTLQALLNKDQPGVTDQQKEFHTDPGRFF